MNPHFFLTGTIFLSGLLLATSAPAQPSSVSPGQLWAQYQQSSSTETGRNAGREALRQWATAPNPDRLQTAAMNLPGGSDLWPDLVEALTEAYRTSADPPRYREGYKALLSNLKQRVTDREDWLTVMIALGDYHRTVTQDRWAALSAYEEAYRQGGSQRLIGAIKERLQSLRPRETDAPAPTFRISTAADSTIDLASLRGDPVLLYFWAPWCSPCLRKFPKLNALQSDYRSANLRMIGLVNDVNDRTELISILDDHDVMWPQAITDDWSQESRTPERLYGAEGPGPPYALGHTVLIDRQGRIAAQGTDLGAIRDTLRAIMSQ